MGRLDGKVALLTGGASGLGRATGELMAKEGATVVLSDIQTVEGENVAALIRAAGGACTFKAHDTTEEAQWKRVCAEILEEHGHLDILLNGAGVGGGGVGIEEMELAMWRRCIAINLDGVFLGCKHGIRTMRQGSGGSIINISSILGLVGSPNVSNYAASKGGAAADQGGGTRMRPQDALGPGELDPSRLHRTLPMVAVPSSAASRVS